MILIFFFFQILTSPLHNIGEDVDRHHHQESDPLSNRNQAAKTDNKIEGDLTTINQKEKREMEILEGIFVKILDFFWNQFLCHHFFILDQTEIIINVIVWWMFVGARIWNEDGADILDKKFCIEHRHETWHQHTKGRRELVISFQRF